MTLQYAAGMLVFAAMILGGFMATDHILHSKQRRRLEEWKEKTKSKDPRV